MGHFKMKLPLFRCPQIGSLTSVASRLRRIPSSCFDQWCVLIMHHPRGVHKHGQLDFDFATKLTCIISVLGTMNGSNVTTASWFPGYIRTPMTHLQQSLRSGSKGPPVKQSCMSSRTCSPRLVFAPLLAALAWISQTLAYGQILSQNMIYRTNVQSHFDHKFSDGDKTVLPDQSPNVVKSSSFLFVEGLPERYPLFTDVQLSLKLSLICLKLIKSLSKAC